MAAYRYLEASNIVSGEPCKLVSVLISTDGDGPGKITLYDETEAVSGQVVATLLCGGNNAVQFRWEGLELSRGLFVQFVEKADYVTVEWEPTS